MAFQYNYAQRVTIPNVKRDILDWETRNNKKVSMTIKNQTTLNEKLISLVQFEVRCKECEEFSSCIIISNGLKELSEEFLLPVILTKPPPGFGAKFIWRPW